MQTTGTITLKQGNGKNTGKPYTALKLTAGKWSALHFPTQFEREYLVEQLKDGKTGSFTINPQTGKLLLAVGDDYFVDYEVESAFERNYLIKFFRPIETEEKASSEVAGNNTLDLSSEDPTPGEKEGLFAN